MSHSVANVDKDTHSSSLFSGDYHVFNWEPTQFVRAMGELEERLYHAALLIQCTECGARITLNRDNLYFVDNWEDPRRDKAGKFCPECGDLQTIPHTDLVELTGVMADV